MDASRFDRLARVFASRATRRSAAGRLFGLAAAFGLVPAADAATCSKKKPCATCKRCKRGKCAAKKDGTPCAGGACRSGRCAAGACKPACGACEECRRGQCAPLPNRTPCGRCKECVGGTCVALANGTACGECEACRDGECRRLPDDATCNGDGRCLNGICNSPPDCRGTGEPCTVGANDMCCNRSCAAGVCDLDRRPDGDACRVDRDCVSRWCVGYRCVGAGSCGYGNDYCGNASQTSGACFCYFVAGSGNVRAGYQAPGSACNNCQSNQECIARHGPRAFCASGSGPNCVCNTDGARNFCAVTC